MIPGLIRDEGLIIVAELCLTQCEKVIKIGQLYFIAAETSETSRAVCSYRRYNAYIEKRF